MAKFTPLMLAALVARIAGATFAADRPQLEPQPPGQPAGDFTKALDLALQAAEPYVKAGFTIDPYYTGGPLRKRSGKSMESQLREGSEYWFWVGRDAPAAGTSVHVYDSNGRLAEAESWPPDQTAGARVVPKE